MTTTSPTCLPTARLIAAVLAACLLLASPLAWATAGFIEVVVGSARVVQTHGQERPAVRGAEFFEGETLITSSNSNLKLRMRDDAQIWIRPDTRFKVERYRSSRHGSTSDEARLNLISGSIRELTGTIGKASPSDYRLATPNAVIGIRGTEFDAVFVTPQAATQLNTPAGTYNRVYDGSTAMAGNAGGPVIVLQRDQAGFIGLASNEPPQVLPSIPSFLSTTSTTSSAPAAPQVRRLMVTLRLGDLPEQRSQVTEGELTSLVVSFGANRTGANRTAGPVSLDAVVAVSGNRATIQFRASSQVISSTGPAQQGPSTVSVTLGTWTDVSGQGPWRESRDVVASTGRGPAPPVYLRVDEAAR